MKLKGSVNQKYLIDMYRKFTKTQEDILSFQHLRDPSPNWSYNQSQSKSWRYKKIEIMPCILSDHHGLKLIFNTNRNTRKPMHSLKLNNYSYHLLSDVWDREETKKENRKFSRIQWKWRYTILKFMGYYESTAKRKVDRIKCLHKEIRIFSYQEFKSTTESSRIERHKFT